MNFASMLLMWLVNVLGILLMPGCTKQNPRMREIITPNPVTANNDSIQYSYLALGDSYTIGEGVTMQERFPFLTTEILRQQKIAVSNLKYIAQTGWSTITLQNAIAAAEPLGNFDIVTLLIGVNDQYQHLDTAGYRTRFTQLLLKAITIAGNKPTRVFVLSIPDYSATPFVNASAKDNVRKEIDAFNAVNKEVSLQNGVSYVDITGLSREAATNTSLLANDRLHYSAIEHLRWAEKLAPLIKAALN